MKRTELLGVLLKAIGFWSLASGISWLPHAVSHLHAYFDEEELMMMMAETLSAPGIFLIGGWLLVRHTDRLVWLASPNVGPSGDEASVREIGEGSSGDPAELLNVILKALGFWQILQGVSRVPYQLTLLYRVDDMQFNSIAYSGITIIAGCIFVFFTDWCVRFAYRQAPTAADAAADHGPNE